MTFSEIIIVICIVSLVILGIFDFIHEIENLHQQAKSVMILTNNIQFIEHTFKDACKDCDFSFTQWREHVSGVTGVKVKSIRRISPLAAMPVYETRIEINEKVLCIVAEGIIK